MDNAIYDLADGTVAVRITTASGDPTAFKKVMHIPRVTIENPAWLKDHIVPAVWWPQGGRIEGISAPPGLYAFLNFGPPGNC